MTRSDFDGGDSDGEGDGEGGRTPSGERNVVEFGAGSGTAIVRGTVVLLVEEAAGPSTDELWEAASSFEELVAFLDGRGIRTLPSLALLAVEGDRVRTVVRGTASIRLHTSRGEELLLDAAGAATWAEHVVGGVESADVALGGGEVEDHTTFRTSGGVVPAGRVTLDAAAISTMAAVAATEPLPPASEPRPPAVGSGFDYHDLLEESDSLDNPQAGAGGRAVRVIPPGGIPPVVNPPAVASDQQPVSSPSSLIQIPPSLRPDTPAADEVLTHTDSPAADEVLAVTCPAEHVNPPDASSCRLCGERIRDAHPRLLAKPSLGMLRFDDGTVVELDGSLLIGRKPSADGMTLEGDPPRAVAVADPGKHLSRTHLEVRVAGWEVQVIDCGSTNLSVLTLPGEEPLQLVPGVAYPITPGTEVDLGEVTRFTYCVEP